MNRADLDRYLDLRLSNEDVRHAKPAPDIYTKAISQLGLQPEECLIVEDNENGIKAARDSGAHVLVVAETCDVNLNNILGKVEQINFDKAAVL